MARRISLATLAFLAVQGAWLRPAAAEPAVENGMFHLRFHYQYFPTPADLTDLKSEVERARDLLCDATDTQVKIKKVTVSFGGASEEDGDVWLLPQPGRSYAGLLGRHVSMFREGPGYSGNTIAHELGHYLLGLGDSYREDILRHNGCGTGPNFEPGTLSPQSNTIMQNSTTVCRLSDGRSLGELDPNWQTACSPSLGCGVCTACSSLPNPPADTLLYCDTGLSSELTVASNFDPSFGTQGACPAPVPASHFFVNASFSRSANNSGPLSAACGNGVTDAGEQCDPNDLVTPLPLCTSFGLAPFGGTDRVACNANCTFRKGTLGPCQEYFPPDRCTATAGLPEACVNEAPPSGATCESYGLVSGSLFSCTRCSVNLRHCLAAQPALCGNGVIDAGEQCDVGARNGTSDPALDAGGQPVTCERFYGSFGSTNFLGCERNCTFNKDSCKTTCAGTAGLPEACTPGAGKELPASTCQDHGFGTGKASCTGCSLELAGCGPAIDPTTFETLRETSLLNSGWHIAIDGLGGIRTVRLYALPFDDTRWELHAVGQSEEYQGGSAGLPEHLRTFRLTFDPSTDQVVSVQSGLEPDQPGTTGTLILGGAPTDGSGEGSPPFVPGVLGQAPPLTLTVNFSGVSRQAWLRYDDTPGSPTGSPRFLAGTTISGGPSPTTKQVAHCSGPESATRCAQQWNATLGSWEGTMHRWDALNASHLAPLRASGQLTSAVSDWRLMELTVPQAYPGSGLAVIAPNLPTAEAPSVADCGGSLDWDDSAVTSFSPDGIVLVVDRSHSMTTPIDAIATYGAGTRENRMVFAQAAARDFLDLIATRPGTKARAGLVSFQTMATAEQPIAAVVTGTPATGEVALTQFKAVVNALQPDGRTAIGLALSQAGQLFEGSTFMAKTIVLLSDGENNEPNPLGAFDPRAVARDLATKGIRVYTVPTGDASDKVLLAEIATMTGGAMFHAPVGDELPAVFAETYARANGEGLVMPRTDVTVSGSIGCGTGEFPCPGSASRLETPLGCVCQFPTSPPPLVTRLFLVNANATRLNVLLSVRNADVSSWGPQFQLVDPSGVVRLDHNSPEISSDGFYRLLSVLTPEPGQWTLRLMAIDLPTQHQFVQAHVEGDGPDCYARLSRGVVAGNEPLVVTATASFAGRVVSAAGISGTVTRPDGSTAFLIFGETNAAGERSAVLDPSQYGGRGVYDVKVTCAVGEGAAFNLGEGAIAPADGEEQSRAPAFVRLTSTAFFVNTSTQPPLPTHGDCDYNGIPDAQEGAADTDADGLPDVCDEDDDADDDPDVTDPDPRNLGCQVEACPTADAGPDQIVECSALATLDGSASSDPDGQPQALSFAWTSTVPLQNATSSIATGSFPLGTSTAALRVSDGPNFDDDEALITVLDRVGPVLTPPTDRATATCTAVDIGQATAVDACGGPVTIVHDAPATFKAGKRVVTWRAIDQFGNVSVATETVVIGLGDDKNCCPSGTHLILGTSNNDTLVGTAGADCIFGFGAQDTLRGLGGNDFLSGGQGDDIVEGNDGDDQLEGGAGQDVLRGGNGFDALVGGDGDDQCFAGIGDDRLHGGQGQDKLFGEDGNDKLFGESGDDRLEGGPGNDALHGGALHDICIGGTGTNTFVLCEAQQ